MPLGLEAPPLWVMGRGVEAMLWTAERVAELPGAMLHLPAMPTAAFLLMIAGGLWLDAVADALAAGGRGAHRRRASRWRLLCGCPTFWSGATARSSPCARTTGGCRRLVRRAPRSSSRAGSSMTATQRSAKEAGKAAGFLCDAVGCRTRVKGLTVAVAQHPAAFADDCRRASILIASIVSPKSCSAPKTVVDFFAARREGTHALYIEDGWPHPGRDGRAARGERPWSGAHGLPPVATASSARGPPNAKEEVNTDPTDRDAEPLDIDQ